MHEQNYFTFHNAFLYEILSVANPTRTWLVFVLQKSLVNELLAEDKPYNNVFKNTFLKHKVALVSEDNYNSYCMLLSFSKQQQTVFHASFVS